MTASTFSGVHDFFNSGLWRLIWTLALFCVALFYFASVYWVNKDARRRIEDGWFVAMATVLGLLLPFLGAFIYMLFRPPEYLEDVLERELEIRAMEERLARRDLYCPVCRADIQPEYLVCPVCTTRLKQPCGNCGKPLDALWQVCPYCETPVDREPVDLSTAPRRSRRK